MTTKKLKELKQRFKDAVAKTIDRDGIDNLRDWLENDTNFFTSPASTRYHGSYEGGLVEHSLNVFNQMIFELETLVGKNWEDIFTMESVAIVALFHDICKVGQYREAEKWRKDADGQWESYLAYEYDPESLSLGHGAKSMFFLQKFMTLTHLEAQAVFWHMGAYDLSNYANVNQLSSAFETNPLAFLIHRADMAATYAVENQHFEFAFDSTDSVEEEAEEEVVEEVKPEPKKEPKPGITRRKKPAPNPEPEEDEEEDEEEKPKSKIRMPKKSVPKPAPDPEPEEDEEGDEEAPAKSNSANDRGVYYFYSEAADVYYKKDENEPDDDSDILVDEEEYLDAMCPVLEEDFYYLLDGKAYVLKKGERLPEEYDEETWEPITKQEFIKRTEEPKAVAKPTRKKPTPSRRPRP